MNSDIDLCFLHYFMLILLPVLYCKLLKGKDYYLELNILNIVHNVLTTWFVLLKICWPMDRTLNSYLKMCGARETEKKVLDIPNQLGMKNMPMWKRLTQR